MPVTLFMPTKNGHGSPTISLRSSILELARSQPFRNLSISNYFLTLTDKERQENSFIAPLIYGILSHVEYR